MKYFSCVLLSTIMATFSLSSMELTQTTFSDDNPFLSLTVPIMYTELFGHLKFKDIMALQTTCSAIRNRFNIELCCADNENTYALAKNFDDYTDYLYHASCKPDEKTFQILWNSQPEKDKQKRCAFVLCIEPKRRTYLSSCKKLTTIKCFNRKKLLSTDNTMQEGIKKSLTKHLEKAINNQDIHNISLILSSPFKDSILNDNARQSLAAFPLYKSLFTTNIAILNLLLNNGAHTNLHDKTSNENFLHPLLLEEYKSNLPDKVLLFIKYQEKHHPGTIQQLIHQQDKYGDTPVHNLIKNFVNAGKHSLAENWNILQKKPTKTGCLEVSTVLMVIKILKKHGLCIDIKNNDDKTPFDIILSDSSNTQINDETKETIRKALYK